MPVRAPSTTIDALEQEFQRKKKRELEQARMTGANGSSDAPAQQRSRRESRPERSLPLRLRQEIQEVPRSGSLG